MTDTVPDAGKPGIIGATISTASGTYFDYLHPELSEIAPQDIARGLSNACRFAGQGPFYSVAQHCVEGSWLIEDRHAFEFLMHDAAEAYLGDVPSPLKQLLPDYKVIEARVERAIAERFGLPHPMPPQVKHMDLRMLRTEKEDLSPDRRKWPAMEGYERAPYKIKPWKPLEAERLWLKRFHELYPEHTARVQ